MKINKRVLNKRRIECGDVIKVVYNGESAYEEYWFVIKELGGKRYHAVDIATGVAGISADTPSEIEAILCGDAIVDWGIVDAEIDVSN
ncbi:hypothetical protein [Ligilactobacillus salivarius]|uniref:Uncharacterized protein n=1 Tax=Ligilactobacillus salivarius TaxID=1624 RepID=A0A9X6SAK6_9LACO|nr:hypothetical protein [Ligilactobacillus salivarius]OTF89766.1 hypothetical protein A8C38_00360 [Ligilactobacillus salivarius]PAY37167.1 hypothetical protein A8C50_11565 [Ligilactobacillus salivarius]PAY38248.1 hypothetical protein A8C54_10850 [Ligilactobacillus salivarius]PAY43073.1 hypothetical protein A8C52_11520 [Ligilactobacillus salivarius]PAY43600.1 hypothetical protein A8C39_00540 [Ligilactobacillus salivarius]